MTILNQTWDYCTVHFICQNGSGTTLKPWAVPVKNYVDPHVSTIHLVSISFQDWLLSSFMAVSHLFDILQSLCLTIPYPFHMTYAPLLLPHDYLSLALHSTNQQWPVQVHDDLGGNLSIRFPNEQKLLIMFSHVKCRFKKFSMCPKS